MDKLRPRAVIFDLGSTLIEYESVSWDVLNKECTASAHSYLVGRGIAVPDEEAFFQALEDVKNEYRRVADADLVEWDMLKAANRLFSRLRIAHDGDLSERFFEAYYEPVERHLYLFDDTLETLARIREVYPVVGLISNTIFPEYAHKKELERFGIAPYLDFTVFSSTFGLRKPHPDIFIRAANLAGVAPSECVYIGDRFREDVEGPLGVGMTPILKLVDIREYPDPLPADLRRIRQLSELVDHLEI